MRVFANRLEPEFGQCLWPPYRWALFLRARPRRSAGVGLTGCSFQFGRTSIHLPREPHLPHFTRRWSDGTSTSSGYFDTSVSA